MSPHNLGGGVSNLRAIFETRTPEDRSASPPSRGRSPALSDASLHSRPVSKVRASFVAVEKPAATEDGQHWGLRKVSDVTKMADNQNELQNGSPADGASETSWRSTLPNGLQNQSEWALQRPSTGEMEQNGLGGILKGSPFEAPSTEDGSWQHGTEVGEPSPTPKTPQKKPANTIVNGKSSAKTQPNMPSQTIGSKIKDAVSSGHNQPPRSEKLNTTPNAKPIKPPPTRQMPPPKPSTTSPTSPRTPRTPKTPKTPGTSVSPKLQKPPTRGSANKAAAVAKSANHAGSPVLATKSPTLAKETQRTSGNNQDESNPVAESGKDSSPLHEAETSAALPKASVPPAIEESTESAGIPDRTKISTMTREGEHQSESTQAGPGDSKKSVKHTSQPKQAEGSPTLSREQMRTPRNSQALSAPRHKASPVTGGAKNDAKRASLDPRHRSSRVPAAAAPTAASSARSHGGKDLARKPTVTKRERPAAKSAAPPAPTAKRVSRTSLPTQAGRNDTTKARTSGARKAPDEGFLSRMMRPTASTAQKAHEKVAPPSPPQVRRTAPKARAGSDFRRSLTRSDEDKENNGQEGQGADAASARAESAQLELNRQAGTEARPLRDITPAPDSPPAPADAAPAAASEAAEASHG